MTRKPSDEMKKKSDNNDVAYAKPARTTNPQGPFTSTAIPKSQANPAHNTTTEEPAWFSESANEPHKSDSLNEREVDSPAAKYPTKDIRAEEAKDVAFGGKPFIINTERLRVHPLVENLFPIEKSNLDSITLNMLGSGYDMSHPLTVIGGTDGYFLVIEGQTRFSASKKAKIKFIPCVQVKLNSDEDIILYVISAQMLRRNCTDPVLLQAAERVLPIEERKAKARQGKSPSAQNGVEGGSSSYIIGRILHVSKTSVDKIKAVLKDPDAKQKVLSEELTINRAYAEIIEKRRVAKEADEIVSSKVTGSVAQLPTAEDKQAATAAKKPVPKVPTVVKPTAEASLPKKDDMPECDATDYNDTNELFSISRKLLTVLLANVKSSAISEISTLLKDCESKVASFIAYALNIDGGTR